MISENARNAPRSYQGKDETSKQIVTFSVEKYLSNSLSLVGTGQIHAQNSEKVGDKVIFKIYDSRFIDGETVYSDFSDIEMYDEEERHSLVLSRSEAMKTTWTDERAQTLRNTISHINSLPLIDQAITYYPLIEDPHVGQTSHVQNEAEYNAFHDFHNLKDLYQYHSFVRTDEQHSRLLRGPSPESDTSLSPVWSAFSSSDGFQVSKDCLVDQSRFLNEEIFERQSQNLNSKLDLHTDGQLLEKSSQGESYKSTDLKAVTDFDIHVVQHEFALATRMYVTARQEIETYQRLQHLQGVCIPRMKTVITVPPAIEFGPLAYVSLPNFDIQVLVLDEVEGITLEQYLKNFEGRELPPDLIQALLFGLHCLANFEFFHPDLEPRNIMIEPPKNGQNFKAFFLDLASTASDWSIYNDRRRGLLPVHCVEGPERTLLASLCSMSYDPTSKLSAAVVQQLETCLSRRWDSIPTVGTQDHLAFHIILEDLCATLDATSAVHFAPLQPWLCRQASTLIHNFRKEGEAPDVWGFKAVQTLASNLKLDAKSSANAFLRRLQSGNCIPAPLMRSRYAYLKAVHSESLNEGFIFPIRRQYPKEITIPPEGFTWENVPKLTQ